MYNFQKEIEKLKIAHEIELEKYYRKGFAHGFHVGQNDDTTAEKIMEWRYNFEHLVIGAPGTFYDGSILKEIDKNDPSEAYEYERKVLSGALRN